MCLLISVDVRSYWNGTYPDQSTPGSVHPIRWNAPERCPPKMHYQKGNEQGPKTALLSFPGSGNTWMRHLLELATGVLFLSFMNGVGFNDKAMRLL